MIRCDVFDLRANLADRQLHWSVETDLPGGTRIIVDISRRFTNTRGDTCLWSMWSEAIHLGPVGPGDYNGASGMLDIDEGDAHGLARFNELLGSYSAGIATSVGDKVFVEATVGARQPMKAFGKHNCHLTGAMVFDSGGINLVREAVELSVKMRSTFQPLH